MTTPTKRPGRPPKLRLVEPEAAAKPRKSKAGRKPWVPTPLERRTVERCVAVGLTSEETAAVIGKPYTTIWRHCRKELETGAAKIRAKVGATLIKRALQGDTACLIFYAKAQLGWREKAVVEHTGKDGGPIVYEAIQADAEAFTARVMALARRHQEAAAIQLEPVPELPPPIPATATEIN